MRFTIFSAVVALAVHGTAARAGELDVAGSVEGTSTGWEEDRAGGATLRAAWMWRDWIGAGFVGRQHYATVDERLLAYFAIGPVVRRAVGPVRVAASVGVVHQHEEPMEAIRHQPVRSLLGVGDGIRHRAGARAGVDVAIPFRRHRRGDFYAAIGVDATWFADDHGPAWQASAGVGLGFTWGR